MKINGVQAHPISFRVPEGQNVRLGIGRAVKREAFIAAHPLIDGPGFV